MKNSIYLLLIMLVLTSCEKDFLDVNTSPNTAVSANADLLFTSAIVEQINIRTQYLQQYGNYYTQHYYSGNRSNFLTDWERYTQTGTLISIWTNNLWNSYSNIQSLKLAEEEALANDFNNTAAQAIILQAEIYLELCLVYEDIPFSEANTIGITDPSFDSQENVFNGIIGLLDKGATLIDINTGGQVSDGDLVYGGDMSKWLKFANSLKFKVIMLKANKDTGAGAELQTFLSTNPSLFESNVDDANVSFFEAVGNQNPGWKLFEAFGAWNFEEDGVEGLGFAMYLSEVSGSILSNYAALDPRLNLLFREADAAVTAGDGFITLGLNGDWTARTAFIDENVYKKDYPDIFLTYSDIELLRAEAITRGFITGDAQGAYEKGARASIQRYNDYATTSESAAAIDLYVEGLPDLSNPTNTTNASTALEHIYLQQYVDGYLRGLKSWTSFRRTGYPDLTPHPQSTIESVINRFPYDNDEPVINKNFPETVKGLGDKTWFGN